jgi:hypothetical protein
MAIEEATAVALTKAGAARWVVFVVREEQKEPFAQDHRGQPRQVNPTTPQRTAVGEAHPLGSGEKSEKTYR